MGKRVAVVLAGCGVFDGSEIHEASAVLVHLSRQQATVKMFAPNTDQMHVVDHLKGSPTEEKRNVLVESARLARGEIEDLGQLNVKELDAIIFPGGFGAAKNLCSWAVNGKDCSVNDQVKAVLQAFHAEKKPIGLCCISPVLAAKVFPGCEVTVGPSKMRGILVFRTQQKPFLSWAASTSVSMWMRLMLMRKIRSSPPVLSCATLHCMKYMMALE
ncbi:glutamine amidotransferase-like class 1 domain-containing protein 3, mitochondrial isoform X1 [Danio aesculapii]|uniref:glutamine amidotransferase-like class 1 domain-containing protein 3, mitochondrial isoform X1 n=1 Tax=Danio aesculapii TaxID=1142201 RepID=UPI0024BFFED9|nr:glutamine amidotransferase-like class 1 domain-containing protein 3, mitochondrial isoform X1 [Danio aesculapii]